MIDTSRDDRILLEIQEVIILFVMILVRHVLILLWLLHLLLMITLFLPSDCVVGLMHVVVDETFPLEEVLAALLLVNLLLSFIS